MKLLTFSFEGREYWGVLLTDPDTGKEYALSPALFQQMESQIRRPTSAYCLRSLTFLKDGWPGDMAGFLSLEDTGMQALRRLHNFAKYYLFHQDRFLLHRCAFPLDEIVIKAPIPCPRLMWGLVQNTTSFARNQPFRTHANLYPQGHQRPASCVVGAGEAAYISPRATYFGYNVEMGVVIGKKGKYIRAEDALDYIAGFTNVVDITVNDVDLDYDRGEKRVGKLDFFVDATASWGSKKMDTSSPVGPYLVTKDEIPNLYALDGYTLADGEVRDHAHMSAQLLGYERVIAFYSSFATLYPGDILHLGTVGVDGLPVPLNKETDKKSFAAGGEFTGLGRISVPVMFQKEGTEEKEPASPIVRKLIAEGRAELASPEAFDVKNIHSLWISFGNYRQCREEEGLVPILDIPRFLNNPSNAVGAEGALVTVPPGFKELALSAELAFVVKKPARNVQESEADGYILGYTPMVGVSDLTLYQSIIEPATPQEKNLPTVYARWGDSYNVIKKVPLAAVSQTENTLILAAGDKQIVCSPKDYLCGPAKLLSTISRYITLLPGDVISLGRLQQRIHLFPGDLVKPREVILHSGSFGEFRFTLVMDKDSLTR